MRNREGSFTTGGQQGAALLMVLLLLIVVTLLGLASMRGAIMQERMTMNTYARSLAFQAGETALRQAEARASGLAVGTFDGITAGTCSGGLCKPPLDLSKPSAWKVAGFWDADPPRYSQVDTAVNGIRPRYVIERMGSAPTEEAAAIDLLSDSTPPTTFQFYRITVRSKGADGAEVLMQSTYRTP